MTRVFVTGMGAITPIGNDVQTFWGNLLNGVCGAGRVSGFDTEDMPHNIACEVKDFDPKQYLDHKTARRLHRSSQFAVAVAKQALADANLTLDESNWDRVGVLMATGGGGLSPVTVLVAVGTIKGMPEQALATMLGYPAGEFETTFPGATLHNHEWWDDSTFANLGTIPAARIEEISEGRLSRDVDVLLNKLVLDHDLALVVGPVLPHEVVGMSGGNKYFFPGIAGHDVIDVSHWIGALITSWQIIGTTGITPVRALINEGCSYIPAEKLAFCVVVEAGSDLLHSISYGDTQSSWADAAQVCAATHVEYLDAPVQRVLSVIPPLYKDIWTAAKGFYKLEPVVADGGEVIIYAPWITEIAQMHPEIYELGYHCRDYFVKQWDRFKDYPWGVLAHSTHLRGAGTYDPETGVEELRVTVTLATAIPEEVCRAANLGYLDPAAVDVDVVKVTVAV